jgi:hypothetical protein
MEYWVGIGVDNLEDRVKAYILMNRCMLDQKKLSKYTFIENLEEDLKDRGIFDNFYKNKSKHNYYLDTSNKSFKKIFNKILENKSATFVNKYEHDHETGPSYITTEKYIKENKVKFISICATEVKKGKTKKELSKFKVTFKYKSYYENKKENLTKIETLNYEAKNLKNLLKILDKEDYDDSIVLNYKAKSRSLSTERDYIKITDESNKVLVKQ